MIGACPLYFILQGDGYAQQLYATRIQAEIMGRGVEINGDKELVREWLAEFQVMENYYILGITAVP